MPSDPVVRPPGFILRLVRLVQMADTLMWIASHATSGNGSSSVVREFWKRGDEGSETGQWKGRSGL